MFLSVLTEYDQISNFFSKWDDNIKHRLKLDVYYLLRGYLGLKKSPLASGPIGPPKGQLIWRGNFGVFKSIKKPTKFL